MQQFTREFAYRENLVFLICDFYQTKGIPNTMLEITNNIALFPIDNNPLIDYILQNLLEQNFKNIILVGDNIENVINYVMITKYDILMNICYWSNDDISGRKRGDRYHLENWGQLFQSLRDFNVRDEFLVLQANHFTTFNFEMLRKVHLKQQNEITFFIHPRTTNDPRFYSYDFSNTGRVYGMHQNKKKKLQENSIKWSSPGIFYCSPNICRIFHEFPDARDFCQLIDELKGVFAFGKFKFSVLTEELLQNINVLDTICDDDAGKVKKLWDGNMMGIFSFLQSAEILEHPKVAALLKYEKSIKVFNSKNSETHYYSNEITTVLDYIEMNLLFKNRSYDFLSNRRISMQVDEFTDKVDIKTKQVVGKLKSVGLRSWNLVVKNKGPCIDLGDGKLINAHDIESEPSEESEEETKGESFFDELINYLKRLSKSENFEDLDSDQITKNITLFKIFWNVASEDVVEAYAGFFIEVVADEISNIKGKSLHDSGSIEDIICKAATFFSLLKHEVNADKNLDKHFMETFFDYAEEYFDNQMKYKVLYAYCYLLRSCKTIRKNLIKEYILKLQSEEATCLKLTESKLG